MSGSSSAIVGETTPTACQSAAPVGGLTRLNCQLPWLPSAATTARPSSAFSSASLMGSPAVASSAATDMPAGWAVSSATSPNERGVGALRTGALLVGLMRTVLTAVLPTFTPSLATTSMRRAVVPGWVEVF